MWIFIWFIEYLSCVQVDGFGNILFCCHGLRLVYVRDNGILKGAVGVWPKLWRDHSMYTVIFEELPTLRNYIVNIVKKNCERILY